MCKLVDDLIESEKKWIAVKMLQDGKLSKKEIAQYFDFTLGQVEDLANSQTMET